MSASLWLALINVAAAESVSSFQSDILLNEDGSFVVTETIQYDFGQARRHGIYRNISNKHAQPASAWYKSRFIDLDLISVSRNGGYEKYTIENYDGLSVKIGDANKTVSGVNTYQITYRVDGAMSQYGDTTELYWNVTGDEWEVPINDVMVRVRGTDGIELRPDQYCYAGASGENASCDSAAISNDLAVFTDDYLSSRHGLTIAQEVTLPFPPKVLESTNSFMLWIIGLVAWVIGLFTVAYRWQNRYKTHNPIIAQYEPLSDFRPMFTGVLYDNVLNPRDISAGILYLAQQGFISIKQSKEKVLLMFEINDYEITLRRPISEAETNFHKEILQLLFDSSEVVGGHVMLSKLKKDTSKLRKNQLAIKKLDKAIDEDLRERGYFEKHNKAGAIVLLSFIALFVYIWFFDFLREHFGFVAVIILFLIISVLAASIAMSGRRTRKGHEALDYLKGFKEFLSVTEKERYEFHNAPSLSPQKFMEFLPYAIAFGVEKQWAEVFRDIQIDSPEWYSSADGTSFNASVFTAGLSAFSTSFAGSTGSSGSSGGGSSGGGSGGGGGGSW